MKQYLVLNFMCSSDEASEKGDMEAWMTWFKAHEASIVDSGAPLQSGCALTGEAASHGVSGYMIIRAQDQEAAFAKLKESPLSGQVEVYEISGRS
ncbi:hypothetical protein ACR6HW_03230 [Fusibacter sp. JL298sf-3]